MFSYEELGVGALVARFLKGGLIPSRINAVGVAGYAGDPDDLLALVKDHLRPRGLTTGFGGRIALTDGVIHHQDIRRPLGMSRDIPAERMLVVLDFGRVAPTIRAGRRIKGLKLVATDLDWTAGSGPTVEGPAEALLMAIAGRGVAVHELTGPGQPTLANRL